MIKLDDLLQNYKLIKNPLDEKKSVLEALNKEFGLNINEKTMFFRQNTVIFKVDAVQKNFIFLNQSKILNFINQINPERQIKGLRF